MSNKVVPTHPAVVFVFSGKRKSGKDFVTEKLKDALGDEICEIMRLSAPLKKQYALENNLDFEKLLDASEYKERVRVDMISWGEARRDADPGYFCRLSTVENPGAHKPVWIISDARRKTDIEYFTKTYPSAMLTVRVEAKPSTRTKRGFVFTKNVDDAPSECDLDGLSFDKVIYNNGTDEITEDSQVLEQVLHAGISDLVQHAKARLNTESQPDS
ncbi:phosphomevalonate kinase-like [Watersipora subatra]|uniref:phosphomevalonate kinase-like n=1 Tax=Watersipora subatra TaxID=2589382 RepID=UPI00355ADDE6